MAYSEEEKRIRHREAKKRYAAKKRKENPKQVTHDNLYRAAKSFVRNHATKNDWQELKKIYNKENKLER
jgi:poly-D-alanine transfer protein DltD